MNLKEHMHYPQSLIIETTSEEKVINRIQSMLCSQETEERCMNCINCRLFRSGNHPDYIFISVPEDKKEISVDQIREVVARKIISPPVTAKFIIIHISEAQNMSTAAQNALLKSLEEPPDFVKFILTTRNHKLLLPTISSRAYIDRDISIEESTSEYNIYEIVSMNLIERFDLVQQLLKADTEVKDEFILEFIKHVMMDLREILIHNNVRSKQARNIINDIRKLQDCAMKIKHNVNKQLALENCLINILDPDIYKG